MTDFQTVLSRCDSCGAGKAPGALFCTHCGLGFGDPADLPPRRLDVDEARTAWGSGGRGLHGPFEAPMGSDERPILWRGDGRFPMLLTARGDLAVIYQLVLGAEGLQPRVVIADLVYETLRGVSVTPSGVFAADPSGLTAARPDRDGAWSLDSGLLPDGADVRGLAADAHGQVHVLVKLGDQLRLYAGRGMTVLRETARGEAGAYAGWHDLAVGPDGDILVWGGGRLGRRRAGKDEIDFEPDARAPDLALSLNDRGEDPGLHGAATPSAQGATPVTAATPSGWGLLSPALGRFSEAPADLARPLAVTGLDDDSSVLFGPDGPTLARSDGPVLTAIPTGGWGRDTPVGGALGVLDDDILAVITTGGSTDAFLLRTDVARRSLALSGAAHFDAGRRAMAAPTPVSSLPPLALAGGVAVGMIQDHLTVWLAPWTGDA